MKIIISEQQYNLIKKDLDEVYPLSWNIETFKNIKSFRSRVLYCDQHLQKIASGSGRVVYKIDDEKVLKLAKNPKGIAQNEIEIEYGNYGDLRDIVARTFDFDNKGLWVEMELARKVKPTQFKQIVGYSFDDFCKGIRIAHEIHVVRNERAQKNKPPFYDDMWEDEFMHDMFNYLIGYDIPYGDLCRLSTYGIVQRNGKNSIVIVDYGLTQDVMDTYYSR